MDGLHHISHLRVQYELVSEAVRSCGYSAAHNLAASRESGVCACVYVNHFNYKQCCAESTSLSDAVHWAHFVTGLGSLDKCRYCDQCPLSLGTFRVSNRRLHRSTPTLGARQHPSRNWHDAGRRTSRRISYLHSYRQCRLWLQHGNLLVHN